VGPQGNAGEAEQRVKIPIAKPAHENAEDKLPAAP
jgi:hypothetical protein